MKTSFRHADEGCGIPAVYHVVKIRDDAEQEKVFCEVHGQEFAARGHLDISESV